MKSGPLEDDAETDPILPYSIAKDAVRRWLASVSKRREVSWKWLRIFYSYGEGQAKTSLIEQFQQAVLSGARTFPMSGGEQLRDYQPVSDLAQQIALASLQTDIQGPINCCSGSPTSVRRLVEQFRGQLSTEIELELGRYPYPDYEPMAYWGLRRKLDSIFASRRT
jgi:dTDP-6-deoxy-L-talose 4-dehydrogenase (NAD+)